MKMKTDAVKNLCNRKSTSEIQQSDRPLAILPMCILSLSKHYTYQLLISGPRKRSILESGENRILYSWTVALGDPDVR